MSTRKGLRRFAALIAMVAAGAGTAHAAGGDALFRARCQACHKAQPGPSGVGPNLFKVGGRKAGTLPGYTYSAALKASGKTWDRATLDAWLTNTRALVPGNKMMAPPVTDATQRAALIDYLLSLK